MDWTQDSINIIDMLRTNPSRLPFADRVAGLKLNNVLEEKINFNLRTEEISQDSSDIQVFLSESEEKELGTEVLLYRHRFTEHIFNSRSFRQAALSVIQNIYLFKHRKIFFGTTSDNTEAERQEALIFLSSWVKGDSVPLSKTFQHFIIARIWNRIVSQSTETTRETFAFTTLHAVVEQINTLRNIYIILSAGLVRKLVGNVNQIYRHSTPYEDAVQIGNFGIARAAYRYHSSCGVRFSTYAGNWVKKEIQRQSLSNRLIRISSSIVENFAKASKTGDTKSLDKFTALLKCSTVDQIACDVDIEKSKTNSGPVPSPEIFVENKQIRKLLHDTLDTILPQKSADIIKRRYGLSPYTVEQTVVEIGETYGVTRGAIYQLEQTALRKLRKKLEKHRVNYC